MCFNLKKFVGYVQVRFLFYGSLKFVRVWNVCPDGGEGMEGRNCAHFSCRRHQAGGRPAGSFMIEAEKKGGFLRQAAAEPGWAYLMEADELHTGWNELFCCSHSVSRGSHNS